MDYLLWWSNDAGLNRPGQLIKIYADAPPKDFDAQVAIWESEKAALYAIAYQVLGATDRIELAETKKEFVAVLRKFSTMTTAMNVEFTSSVLRSLQKTISSQKARGAKSVRIESDFAPVFLGLIRVTRDGASSPHQLFLFSRERLPAKQVPELDRKGDSSLPPRNGDCGLPAK